MYLIYDSNLREAAAVAAQLAESGETFRLVDVADQNPTQRHAVTWKILGDCLGIAAQSSGQRADARAHLSEMLVECSCWFCTPDGVAGPVDLEQAAAVDIGLLLREAAYHRDLSRPTARELEAALESLTVSAASTDSASLCAQAAAILELHGAVVVSAFLGEQRATELADTDFGSLSPANPGIEGSPSLGGGRGDWAVLPVEAPEQFLAQLDSFVAGLRPLAEGKMQTCEFRTWPMVTVYEPGMRYTWHLDNGNCKNGRLLTCIYYFNKEWPAESGGQLRLLKQKTCEMQILAEVPPVFDTLVLFWSASVPHEVLPPWTRLRHAISVWYLCPLCGGEHFSVGHAEAAFGQSVQSAVERIRSALQATQPTALQEADAVLHQLVELERRSDKKA